MTAMFIMVYVLVVADDVFGHGVGHGFLFDNSNQTWVTLEWSRAT